MSNLDYNSINGTSFFLVENGTRPYKLSLSYEHMEEIELSYIGNFTVKQLKDFTLGSETVNFVDQWIDKTTSNYCLYHHRIENRSLAVTNTFNISEHISKSVFEGNWDEHKEESEIVTIVPSTVKHLSDIWCFKKLKKLNLVISLDTLVIPFRIEAPKVLQVAHLCDDMDKVIDLSKVEHLIFKMSGLDINLDLPELSNCRSITSSFRHLLEVTTLPKYLETIIVTGLENENYENLLKRVNWLKNKSPNVKVKALLETSKIKVLDEPVYMNREFKDYKPCSWGDIPDFFTKIIYDSPYNVFDGIVFQLGTGYNLTVDYHNTQCKSARFTQ